MITEYNNKDKIIEAISKLLQKTDKYSNRILFLDKILYNFYKRNNEMYKIIFSKNNYAHAIFVFHHASKEMIDYFLKINQTISFQEDFQEKYKGIVNFSLFNEIKYYNFHIIDKYAYDNENEYSIVLDLSIYAIMYFRNILKILEEQKIAINEEPILFDPNIYFDFQEKNPKKYEEIINNIFQKIDNQTSQNSQQEQETPGDENNQEEEENEQEQEEQINDQEENQEQEETKNEAGEEGFSG